MTVQFCQAEGPSLSQIERKLAAIFAADVDGYSRLMGIDEVGTLRALTTYREIIDALIAQDRGRIFNTAGDSVVAEFPSVVDAVHCAVEVQRVLGAENAKRSSDKQMRFRIGVHVGDVLVQGDNLFGDGVNVAARLETLAEPGGICVSGSVRDYVGKKLPVVFTDCGEQAVKNIAEPVRAYRIGASATLATGAHERPSLPLPDKPSIAVLPFQNMSADPEQEYFADGIVEEIITALSRFRSLFVIARNSTFTYKARAVDVKQVGRELGARYVLEGSVRKAANRVRITGQLIDTLTGVHLWADRFEGAIDDIFDLQDQVTASVVGAIAPKLEQAEIERARTKPTENLNAYDLYLRALPHYYPLTRAGSDEALRLLRDAVSLDPNYALAKALAAVCIGVREVQGISLSKGETDEGIRLAREALDGGWDDPSVLELGGWALSELAHDNEAGLAALDRALLLNVNSAQALRLSGWVRLHSSDPRTATEHFSRSIRLSPLDPHITYAFCGLGMAHVMSGDYDEAVKFGRQAAREQPRNALAHRIIAASLALLGRTEEARTAMRALLAIAPNLTMARAALHTYDDAEFVERYRRGLREAGLPE
jgi:adenylate cyclase